MKSVSNEKTVLAFVAIIGVLGVVALLFNVVSGDVTGQATSSLRISSSPSLRTTCSDSDNGREYFDAGTATAKSTSETDYCLPEEDGYPPGLLYEVYCSNNRVTHEIIVCMEHGGLGCETTTEGGQCVQPPTATGSGTSASSTVTTNTGGGSGDSGLNLG